VHTGPGFKRSIEATGDARVVMSDATGFTIHDPHQTVIKSLGSGYDPAKDEALKAIHFQSGFDNTRPTLDMHFVNGAIGQRYFTWEMETEDGRQVNVQRYSVLLENSSEQDLENVSVKLERILEEDANADSPYLGYELQLNPPTTRIRRKDKTWLPLISYRRDDAGGWISIEGVAKDRASKEGRIFTPRRRRQLYIAVRADRDIFLPAKFQCWVEDNGCLIMKRLNIPNSSTQ
jgi:hypothetical protein